MAHRRVPPRRPVEGAVERDASRIGNGVLSVGEADAVAEAADGGKGIDRLPEEVARVEVDRQVRTGLGDALESRDVEHRGTRLQLEAEAEALALLERERGHDLPVRQHPLLPIALGLVLEPREPARARESGSTARHADDPVDAERAREPDRLPQA